MQKLNDDHKRNFLLVTYGIVLFLALSNIGKIGNAIDYTMSILSPIFTGIIVAFLLNIFVRLFETKLLAVLWRKNKFLDKHKRAISIILAVIVALLIIILLLVFIIPQLSNSISRLTNGIPRYVEQLQIWLNEIARDFNISDNIIKTLEQNWQSILTSVTDVASTAIPGIVNTTMNISTGILNFVLGIIISIYLLSSKESLIRALKKVVIAVFPDRAANQIIGVCSEANETLNRFIAGQVTEAFILGVLCFIGMTIFRFDYPLLISVIIGVTAVIPILGAYIGVIPAVFILLLINPMKALWFIVFIIVLQQFEGNVIYPKVVGGAVGINGLWVLVAIVVGGSLFGVIGMLLGVPAISVLLSVFRRVINHRLEKKKKLAGHGENE